MRPFSTSAAGKFFDLTCSIVEGEIKGGNTVSLLNQIDASNIESVRRLLSNDRPSYTAFIVKALSIALKEFPYANRRLYRSVFWPFGGLRFQNFETCDISVASERNEPGVEVATFVDVMREADRKSLFEINSWLRALSLSDESNNQQWRDFRNIGMHWPRWLARLAIRLPVLFPAYWHRYRGGSVLISSPAKYGVDMMTGSWTATLGVSFGLVKQRPLVIEGQVVSRPTFWFLVNFDRRVMAGAQAARFFKRLTFLLENPTPTLIALETPEVRPSERPALVEVSRLMG